MIKYEWLKAYLETKPHAIHDYKIEWDADRFLLEDKMFVLIGTDKTGRDVISVKLAPEYGILLRELYKDKIIAGYYLNKIHWNSIYLDTDIDSTLIKELIDESYQLIFKSLPKNKQKQLNKEL